MRALITTILLATTLAAAAGAQHEGRILGKIPPGAPVDFVYWPGEVAENLGLEEFLPEALHPASAALRRGDLAAAEQAFGDEVRKHPHDLAAQIGYLQAMRGKLAGLLPRYKQAAATAPSVANDFRLGVLVYYLYGTLWQDIGDRAMARKRELGRFALTHLEKAYGRDPEPIVGFTLALAYAQVGIPLLPEHDRFHRVVYRHGPRIPVYDQMLRRLAGDEAYRQYHAAARNHWTGAPPPVRAAPRGELRQLSYLVACLWSSASGRGQRRITRTVNGKTTTVTEWDTIPPERQRQIAWLWNWRQKIRQAWGWKPDASALRK